MKGLEALIKRDEIAATNVFSGMGFTVSAWDRAYILARYNIFAGKIDQANQIIAAIPASKGQEARIARLKRAIATLQHNQREANKQLDYLRSIKQLKNPANGQPIDEVYLRNQSYAGFRPWINRITPYLAQ